MLNFPNRSPLKELLDRDGIPFEDICRNMQELDTVNTLLGGHDVTWKGIEHFLPAKNLYIAEIGSGGGDNLRYISKRLNTLGVEHKCVGIDIKQACVEYARERAAGIEFICSDYRDMVFDQKPDVIFSSLFCHHFNESGLIEQVAWMKQNTAAGFFINDLHRNKIAYHAIKILSSLFSRSYLVKHDAPLSVKRSFVKADWQSIFEKAGVQPVSIQWKWAFRYLLVYKHGNA